MAESPVYRTAIFRHRHHFILLGALMILAPQIAPARAQSDWPAVEAAAKKEGKVVVYSGASPASTPQAIALFEQKYGIPVEIIIGRGGEIRERARTELGAGRSIGDVVLNGVTTSSEQAVAGDFQTYGALPRAGQLVAPFTNDGILMPIYTTSWGILINTSLVAKADEPGSWADLTDQKWRGKLLSDNPMSPGGGQSTYAVFFEKFGKPFLEKLTAQKPDLSNQYTNAQQRVARGEFSVYFPFIVSEIFNLQGLPVKGILPSEGKTYSYQAASIMKNAPHPNAARLFIDFLLSDEVQATFANRGYGSPTGATSSTVPSDLKPLFGGKLLGFADTAMRERADPTIKALFR